MAPVCACADSRPSLVGRGRIPHKRTGGFPVDQLTKFCAGCERSLPIDRFSLRYEKGRSPESRASRCKECACRRRSEWARRTGYSLVEEERRKANPEYLRKKSIRQREWRERNGDKKRAHKICWTAEKRGILKPPTGCQSCGVEVRRLHKHHADYARPLDVVWLCPSCHMRTHAGSL